MKKSLLFAFLFITTLGVTSCSKDDNPEKKEEEPKAISIVGKWNITQRKIDDKKWVDVSEDKDYIIFNEDKTYKSNRYGLPDNGTYTYDMKNKIVDMKSSQPYDDEDMKIIEITEKEAEVEFYEPNNPNNLAKRYKMVRE